MKKKVILIDGNSLVYRAFFALPPTLATSKGQPTNAAYGFTSMLIKLLKDEKPDVVIVAFDKGKATFRHEEFEEYKAHRQPTPNELISQFPIVKEILKSLEIPIFEMDGFEADDILATIASIAEKENDDVIVVTGDRDAFQLIDDHVRVMTTRKGISDIVIYDKNKVEEKYGIKPEQVADYLALKGDASDNIPGVPGFGEKTAAKLIQQYGNLENLIENIETVENKRWKEKLKEYIEEARLSKRLATLDKNVPIDIDLEKCRYGKWDTEKVRKVFKDLEFYSLLERLLTQPNKQNKSSDKQREDEQDATNEDNNTKHNNSDHEKTVSTNKNQKDIPQIKKISNKEELDELIALLAGIKSFAFSISSVGSNSVDQQITGISIAFLTDDQEQVFVYSEPMQMTFDFSGLDGQEDKKKIDIYLVLNSIKPVLENQTIEKMGHDLKKSILAFWNHNINLKGINFDSMIAAYLSNPDRSNYSLDELTAVHIGLSLASLRADSTVSENALAIEALAILRLKPLLEDNLKKDNLYKLFEEIEMPLVGVLALMEKEGIGVDLEYLKDLSKELDIMLENIQNEIFSIAGQEFNINSPQQLGFILFEKLNLPKQKKTKTGYSTDANVLAKLINVHPIIEKITSFRELSKLKSTYVDALPKLINPKTGRLHTTFNQAITSTGRLSSSNPNLQNIPIRTEIGQRIRQAFIPTSPDDMFIAADYSQIELRLLAHFSKEEVLIKAFAENRDIHEATACELFDVLPEQVTPSMRRIAKMVNFGVLYGMSSYGLSERLGISVSDAKDFIDRYFSRLPKVQQFIQQTIEEAHKKGYVETLTGRRRYVPELRSQNKQVRALGERFAVNAPLQGSAADIIKLAMIRISKKIQENNLRLKMLLQVHDELIFEAQRENIESFTSIIRNIMENAYPLRIKLKVEISVGNNWKNTK